MIFLLSHFTLCLGACHLGTNQMQLFLKLMQKLYSKWKALGNRASYRRRESSFAALHILNI